MVADVGFFVQKVVQCKTGHLTCALRTLQRYVGYTGGLSTGGKGDCTCSLRSNRCCRRITGAMRRVFRQRPLPESRFRST